MKTTFFTLLGAGALAALSASLCCVTPVVTLLAGIGGAATNLAFLNPLRPFLIILTVGAIGMAWYPHLKSEKADACGCQPAARKSFAGSKVFLSLVTVLATLMLIFPSYAYLFYSPLAPQAISPIQQTAQRMTFEVTGMTCRGCEKHVEDQVSKLPGVVRVKASYDQSTTVVAFDPTKASVGDITKAIGLTGYKVLSSHSIR